MSKHSGWWIVLGTVAGGVVAGAIAWALAGADVNKEGDWRNGAARFLGFVTALGLVGGHLVARRLVAGVAVTRDGYTLSYRAIHPTAEGYREMKTTSVADLLAALAATGYRPRAEACDEAGQPAGSIDATHPLAGANVAIRDPGVRGWIRLQLAPPIEGRARALGLVEVWSERGTSADELALFTLRALDGLIGSVAASRESSRLSEDPVSLLTAGLGERPVHRS
jgi:hypothetical protein